MKNKIIRTENLKKRNLIVSFILSLLFTGLGQMYNGDLLKGVVFFVFRILTLLIIPVYITFNIIESYIYFFVVIAFLHTMAILLSPVEAVFSARKKAEISLNRYNSLIFYFFYAILSLIISILPLSLTSSFFSIEKVKTDLMHPSLLEEEYALVYRYTKNGFVPGDVISYAGKNEEIRMGRVLANGGDIVNFNDNAYQINGKALPLGIFSDEELNMKGQENAENLFFEVNSGRKYAVKSYTSKLSSNSMENSGILVDENILFIAFDNRTKESKYDLVDISSVTGRIEGIIYSDRLNRILMKTFMTIGD